MQDLDLLLQELAPGDDPEWQDARTREPPDGRAVDEVELLDDLVIGLRQLGLGLALLIPAGKEAEADGGVAGGLVDEARVDLNRHVPERNVPGGRLAVEALDLVTAQD